MTQWDVLVDGPPHSGGTPSAVQAHACFLFNTLLCIGYSRCDRGAGLTDPRLPQADFRLHVDEAGVLPELPVRVVGDPPLPVVAVNHFPRR